ncbi:DUF4232 domain-containing protein [Streptomyces sediminimaris]|uniref:DUF4232 domain-containing protein n=1 Tax=Streptomyces sediminimaris TaxID=3383721 RepID=UPI00399A6B0D
MAALSLVAACDGGQGGGGDSGARQPGAGVSSSASAGGTGLAGDTGSGTAATTNTAGTAGAGSTAGTGSDTSKGSGSRTSHAAGARCDASQLRGHVGANDPGAGQENFPLVVTNFSGSACTLDGYPGTAFVDGSGRQVGPDPRRAAGTPVKITLAPGRSAWAGLSFGNPEISGAKTATPTGILITPPDEKEPLKVDWTGGAVPVSDAARLTVFRAGNGA